MELLSETNSNPSLAFRQITVSQLVFPSTKWRKILAQPNRRRNKITQHFECLMEKVSEDVGRSLEGEHCKKRVTSLC